MMDVMRQWLLAVVCGAMLAAVIQALLPKGGAGRIGRLAGSLVLLLAVISPLLRLDAQELTLSMTKYRLAQSEYVEDLSKMNREVLKEIIAEQTEAYILDKAQELGITCRVTVLCEGGDAETPCPSQVRVTGELSPEQEQSLMRVIETQLGIPAQDQVYERGVG